MHAGRMRVSAVGLAAAGALAMLIPAQMLAAAAPVRVSITQGPLHVLHELTSLARPSTAPDNRVCRAAIGDTGTVEKAVATPGASVHWIRVRFASGACQGRTGWVASDALRAE